MTLNLKQLLEAIVNKLPVDADTPELLESVTMLANKKYSDLPAVVTQKTTDLYALSDNGDGSYKETRAQMLAYMQNHIVDAANTIFYAKNGNDTTGNGSANAPYATYEKARSTAALTASATNRFLINGIGDFSITGDLTISPYISHYQYVGKITITGSVILDAAWAALNNEFVVFKGFNIQATAILLDYTAGKGNTVIFDSPYFNTTGSLTVNSPNTNSGANRWNGIAILRNADVRSNPFSGGGGGITINNGVLYGQQLKFGGGPTNLNIVSNGTSGAVLNLLDSQFPGNINLTRSAGAITTTIYTSPGLSTLNLDGTGISVSIDCSSYSREFTSFLNGASIANINLVNTSSGLKVTDYSPSNFTPTGDTSYGSTTITAYFHGLDLALDVSNFTLQTDYNNGDGTLNTDLDKPLKINHYNSNVVSSPIIASTGTTFSRISCVDAFENAKNIAWNTNSVGLYSLTLYDDDWSNPVNAMELTRDGTTPTIINFLSNVLAWNGDVLVKLNQMVVQTWNGSNTPVNVTNGTGIDITDGVISSSVTTSGLTYISASGNNIDAARIDLQTDVTNVLSISSIQQIAAFRLLGNNFNSVHGIQQLLLGNGLDFDGSGVFAKMASGTYTPTVANVANFGSFGDEDGSYFTVNNTVGNRCQATVNFTCTPSTISGVFSVSIPIGGNFPGAGKAKFVGGIAYDTGTNAIFCNFRAIESNASNTINAALTTPLGAVGVQIFVQMTFEYEIQAP